MADRTAPTPPGDPLVAGSVGEWLRQSRATTRRSLIPLVAIQLVVFVPVAAVAAATGTLGHFPDSSPAPRFGFAYPLQLGPGPYQVVAALLGAVGLAAIGYLLLVVPGIYLSIVFTASLLGVVTIERGAPARCTAGRSPSGHCRCSWPWCSR